MTNPQTLTQILRYVDSFQLETQTLPTAAMIAEAVPSPEVGESLKQLVSDGFLLDYPANLIYAISYSGRYLLQLKTDPSALDPAKIKAAYESNEYAIRRMHDNKINTIRRAIWSEAID